MQDYDTLFQKKDTVPLGAGHNNEDDIRTQLTSKLETNVTLCVGKRRAINDRGNHSSSKNDGNAEA